MTSAEFREYQRTNRLPARLAAAMPAPAPIETTEDDGETKIQCDLVRALRSRGFTVFHVPNGGKRRTIEAAILVGMGAMAGVADLEVLLPAGRTVRIEVKGRDGRQSDDQLAFESTCKRLGHEYHVVRSVAAGLELASDWPTPETP